MQTEMSWCRSDQITSRYVWGRMRGDTLGSEEETFPDVSAALRRGIVKKKGTFEIWCRERWKCELCLLFRRES